jgi:hypothetical protein
LWLLKVFNAEYDEVVVVRIENHPVRPGEMAVDGRRDVPHRDGIVDIAADHVELAGPYRDDDIAVPGKAAGRQIVIGDRLSASPVADQVAA